jgi:Holliday junction DNA helicase RuvA
MIGYIEGEVRQVNEKYALISVGGLGYKVFATAETLARTNGMTHVALFTYLAVREDALDLYGFETEDEKSLFELLIGVSGIGPRSGLGILSIASVDMLERAIATGDTGYLTKVSGIGKKTAEKIVIELRDKMRARGDNESKMDLRGESDAIEALKALGYSQMEAREALKQVDPSVEGTNQRIKDALKFLAK